MPLLEAGILGIIPVLPSLHSVTSPSQCDASLSVTPASQCDASGRSPVLPLSIFCVFSLSTLCFSRIRRIRSADSLSDPVIFTASGRKKSPFLQSSKRFIILSMLTVIFTALTSSSSVRASSSSGVLSMFS